MKTRAAAMWRDGRAWLLALGLAQVPAACAQTANTGSGETHFLDRCDAGCGDRLECRRDVCSRACTSDDTCAALGANATCVEHDGESNRSCDQLCEGDADCLSLGAEFSCVDGACRASPELPEVGGSGGGAGSPGSGGTAGSDVRVCAEGCEAGCAIEPSCLLETTCSGLDCGGPVLLANACYRDGCEGDGDCQPSERCLILDWDELNKCNVNEHPCTCIHPYASSGVCSPTALAGPRGEWESIVIIEDGAPSVIYPTIWTIFPDGSLQKLVPQAAAGEDMPNQTEHQLTTDELAELRRIVDGTELRPALEDPNACGEAEDYSVSVELVLDTGRWKQFVTDCTLNGPTRRSPFPELLQLAKKY